MKTTMRGLTLAAVMLSASSAMADSNDSDYFGYEEDTPVSAVGDLPGYGDEAYFAETASYAESTRTVARTNYAAPAARSAPVRQQAAESRRYQPVAYNALQPSYNEQSSFHEGGCGIDTNWGGGCDGGCDGGPSCGCGSCGSGGKLGRMMRGCDNTTWAIAEALLWFPENRKTPPLVSVAQAGGDPSLAVDGTTVFGGSVNSGLSAGFRGDFGKFVRPNIGFGGRFWILGDATSDFGGSGLAPDATGIPFFNTGTIGSGENAVVVTGNAGLGGANSYLGSGSVNTRLKMLGAEAYGRFRLTSSDHCTIDLIGGYSHFNVDDSTEMYSERRNVTDPATPETGRTDSFYDRFQTKNRFDGGQFGFETVLYHGRWMARTLTKLHLGNNQQRSEILGQTTTTPAGGAMETYDHGLFAGEQSVIEKNRFTLAPELNFKLAYRFRPNVSLSAGYSILYWDHLALSGAQIDRNVNFDNIFSNVNAAAPTSIVDSSLFIHGVDVGVVLDF